MIAKGSRRRGALHSPLTPTLFYENPFLVKPVVSHFDTPAASLSDVGAHQ
jgi:hypothetical protein